MIATLELRSKYPFKEILSYYKLSRSTYYYVIKSLSNVDKDIDIKKLIQIIFNKHKSRYGYRRITLEINKTIKVNHKKVKRIMKELGLFGKCPKVKYKSYNGEVGKIAPNIINRNFNANQPNQKWTTDVSEFAIAEGKLYLSPILDMYGSEIVSYSISRHPNFSQTVEMLNKAFEENNVEGLILHSDQGWQYQMRHYQKMLKDKGVIQSMSRKGNCLDNSIMENFFGILKNEMFYGHEKEFKTLCQLEEAIKEYIDYYNKDRIKTKLKGLSPYCYRHKSLNEVTYL